jgi:hypothetical protein
MKKLMLGIGLVLAPVLALSVQAKAQYGTQCFDNTRVVVASGSSGVNWWQINREECYNGDGYFFLYWTDINGATPNPPHDDGD